MLTTNTSKNSRKGKMLAAAAALSLVAAACSSDGDDAVIDDSPVETEAPMDTEAPMETDAPMDTEAPMDEDMDEDMDMGDSPAFGPACESIPTDGEGSLAGMTDDPAATAASNNPLLSTLVAAVTEADLVDTLNSDGPFTIFAPANAAFEALGEDTVNSVLADQELLTSILTYHVVAGESLNAEGLGEAGTAASVNGGELTFSEDGTAVNGVDVLCSDIVTANATVHVIGEVLMPPAAGDSEGEAQGAAGPTGPLCEAVPTEGEGSFDGMTDDPAGTAASNNPALSTLVAAVTEAGLVDTLNSDGPFTIFAPANPAFDALGEDTVNAVLADQELLTSILTLHVIAGEQYSSSDLAELDSLETVNGQEITFEVDGDTLMVNGQASVGCADVMTANATVHILDAVLMPA